MTPRTTPSLRLAEAWNQGHSPGPSVMMAVASAGYRGLLGTRDWLYACRLLRSRGVACPVVSIGNLTVGGTGKTPAAELAVRTLLDLGRRPAVVSRGYGRRTTGTQIVADTASIRLDAEDAGDEPFLLARRLPGVPVVIGSNRWEAAGVAIERFPVDTIVLDDGFQHRTLAKDLEIVMARADRPWGNGRLLPAGPLREPLGALARAHLIVVTGVDRVEDLDEVIQAARRHAPDVPVLGGRYVPTECWEAGARQVVPLPALAGTRLLAFAGIAAPQGFARTLATLGIAIEGVIPFPDHYWYSSGDVEALDARASGLGMDGFITTEKDWVRLRQLRLPRRPLYVLGVRLELLAGSIVWRAAFERACSRE